MKKLLLSSLALLAAGTMAMAEDVPAFPGAEGHGRYATGGRTGTPQIIHVTNLNDSGDGSLRSALAKSGSKIIVFDVSGYIDLKSDLAVKDNTTILGQTAPAGGITLRYRTLTFTNCNNAVVRFIRSRRSQVQDVNDGADAAWGRRKSNIIIDHCSFSWSIDELASFYDNKNFTMQWTTMGEGLCNPGHSKGAHSYGGIWGGKEASFHHNFMLHVQNRAPRINGARYEWTGWDATKYENTVDAERVDLRNLLFYNWGNGNGSYGGPGGGYVNMVNNYFKAGPGTKNKTNVTQVSVGSSSNSTNTNLLGLASRYYIDGNYVTAASTPANYDWSGVSYDSGLSTINSERYIPDPNHWYGTKVDYVQNSSGVDCVRLRLDEPITTGDVTTHEAQTAYEKILAYSGASLWRDAVDVRYIEECRTGTVTYHGDEAYVAADGTKYAVSGTEGIVDWINDPTSSTQSSKVPSYPYLPTNTHPADFDTDGDGIPDIFEILNNLNPNDASDALLYTLDPRGWYTNIEVYANSLVEDIMKNGNADAIDAVDEYYPPCNRVDIGNSNTDSNGITGIAAVTAGSGQIKEFRYYDLKGNLLSEPGEGISIRQIIYTDGSSYTDKVIKR